MQEQEEYYDEIRSIERYFANTDAGSILFAICNDEKLLANINTQIEFVLNGKRKHIAVHSFKQGDADTPPIQRIRNTLAKQEKTNGIIFIDAEGELYNNPNLFTQINFARELLLEFNIPMLFWMNERTIQLFRQQAIDFYNQRALADVYFTSHSPEVESDRLFEEYKAVQISLNNPNLKQHEARLKLLQKQLHQAEEANLSKDTIANDIVFELIYIYAQMPNMAKSIERLINKYQTYFNDENHELNFKLGYAYKYLNDIKHSETFYTKALEQHRKLAEISPHAYLPHLAQTLNNLALLHNNKNEQNIAEKEFIEALGINRKLAQVDPLLYLPDVMLGLNNLAVLHSEANEFNIAKKEFAEALEISKKLAETNPLTYLPDVVQSLNNLAILHSNANELSIAEKEYMAALEIIRQLADINPQGYLPEVAQILNNLAILHYNKTELKVAEKEYTEALEIRKKLTETNPLAYLPDVAQTLNNLAILHSDKNDLATAEEEYLEALQIRRNLAKINPQVNLIDLAHTLYNFSTFYLYKISNKRLSLKHVLEALIILQNFQYLHQGKNYTSKCFQILKAWQIDPATFLEENNINISIENQPT